MTDRYERVYDVGLLDDLHNYFPGLLYEPDRFRTVSDVLTYIRQNTSRRFNLFDYGARQYSQQNTRVPQNTFTRQTPVVNRWTAPSVPIVSSTANGQPSHLEFDLTNDNDLAVLFPLLRSLDRIISTPSTQPIQRAHGQNRFTGIFQDIVVHASQELLDGSSNLRTLLMDLEETCSICQDRMRQGENIRRLNACQHEFHGVCVDNWLLQRSVMCPVCRHDIRDPTPVLRSPRLTSAEAPSIPPITEEDETDESNSSLPGATRGNQTTSRLRNRSDFMGGLFNRRLP